MQLIALYRAINTKQQHHHQLHQLGVPRGSATLPFLPLPVRRDERLRVRGGGLEGIQHRLAQEESFRALRCLHVSVQVDGWSWEDGSSVCYLLSVFVTFNSERKEDKDILVHDQLSNLYYNYTLLVRAPAS